jgi:thiamine biosynthesis lipoprotein
MYKAYRWLLTVLVLGVVFGFTSIVLFWQQVRHTSGYVSVQSGHRQVMGTFAQITAVAVDTNTASLAIEAAFEQLRLVDNLMSDYKSDSELSRVNREAFDEPVAVSPLTFEVLQRSLAFSKTSNGAFDITVGPLVDLWHKANDTNMMPTSEELSVAKAKVGYEKLILDSNTHTVRFAVKGMRLDLGAIAKGYAVDFAVEAMKKAGAKGGLVEAGGELKCFGMPSQNKKEWIIGIQDPAAVSYAPVGGEASLKLKLTNAAVATSASYYRYTAVAGRHITHIIDPNTGLGANKLSSVTVIAPNAADADALGTAVSVLGIQRGKALVESYPDTSGIFIGGPPDYKIVFTGRAQEFSYKD